MTTHVINLAKQQLHLHGSQSVPQPVQWIKKSAIDAGSSLIIPVRPTTETGGGGGGVVVIGQRQFTYCSAKAAKVLPVPPALFLAWTELPPGEQGMPRYLVADEFGNLNMLSIMTVNDRVVALQFETLGSCSLATSLAYLGDGLLYVGSAMGDSQLVQIHDEPIPIEPTMMMEGGAENSAADGLETDDSMLDTTYLSVVDEYTNLGPILDFDLVPTTPGGAVAADMGQSQVVTASGSSKTGSIRVIRNGIGMNEYAAVEIPGIQAMWSLRKSFRDADDTYLVQSFVGETRVLGVAAATTGADVMRDDAAAGDDEEEEEEVGGTLEEVVLPGLESSASTLYVGNVQAGDRLLQITESEVRLIAWSGDVLSTWKAQITVASANEAGQIAVALQGGMLVYLTIEADQITKIYENQMDREVSCVDVHPFALTDGADSMDIEEEGSTDVAARKSSLIAVGLWDDFTVRVLSIESNLEELMCINLSTDDEDEVEESTGSGPSRRRNNMMARSLSLITLDFSSAAGSHSNNSNSSAGVNMLFVGLGDGTLISFAVVSNKGVVSVQSKKEVCLGTQRIDLIPLTSEHGGTCLLATGDRPTVIYLAGVGGTSANQFNPKLCYSNVNVASSDDEEADDVSRPPSQQSIAVNVAAPFFSPLLFDAASLGNQHYSLCVADDASLRLGVIDDIQKLHVTTCRLGMAPRRIVHCVEGRLFAVGCIASGIQNFGLGGDEANMGNCIRFLDDSTLDDLEKIDLEPYEMIMSMVYATLKVPSSAPSADTTSTGTSEPVHKPFLLVGTAYALPDEDEPSRGRILVYSCQADEGSGTGTSNTRAVRQITEFSVGGGVYSMCQFYEGKLLITVNTRTHICHLVQDAGLLKLQFLGLGHFGHILSLFVKSRARRSTPEQAGRTSDSDEDLSMEISEAEGSNKKKEAKEPEEMLAIVGDLMRSISLVQYYPEHQTLEEVARDFNTNWTVAMEMLNDNVYLGAENWNNLFCLRRNTAAANEEVRCRLDTIGEYHLGEMCNKFMSGSLVMPVSTNSSSSSRRNIRRGAATPQKKNPESPSKSGGAAASRFRRPIVTTGSQTLFGTVDGTLGVILGLDGRTTAFFSTLERCMANVIRPVGDFGHQQHRACHAERRVHPAHGFVDGDLVESFLDLDRSTMEAIVAEMNRDGSWEFDDSILRGGSADPKEKTNDPEEAGAAAADDEDLHALSVDDVLAMVEEMTMLH